MARINNIGTPAVVPPERSPQVGAVRGTTPIGQQTSGTPAPAPAAPAASGEAAPPPSASERRQLSRRGPDRRTRQVPVLIDTRVSQRRKKRRRNLDTPPDSVDVDA